MPGFPLIVTLPRIKAAIATTRRPPINAIKAPSDRLRIVTISNSDPTNVPNGRLQVSFFRPAAHLSSQRLLTPNHESLLPITSTSHVSPITFHLSPPR